jgi:hypothetical protein
MKIKCDKEILNIKGRLVEVENINGIPTIKATSKEIKHPDGRIDIEIHVPCLKVINNIGKERKNKVVEKS